MDEKYFEEIPLWSGSSPRLVVMADAISGRIPVTRLDSWKQFSELLEDNFFNPLGTQFIYRGHRRHDWSLLPTLGRVSENGIVTDALADAQMTLFRRAVRGRLADNTLLEPNDDTADELWSIGQHHGLMTPLLDWTYSPYVALFFAFAKEDVKGEEDNPYRSIYILNKTFVEDDGLCPDIRLLEPRKDDHGRLVNQAGLFTYSPSDSTIENKLIEIISDFDEFKEIDEGSEGEILGKYICKVYIRNEDREGCLRALRRMNVHHASLFPDLLGASDYCNILIEEAERERAIAQAEAQQGAAAKAPEKVVSEPEGVDAESPLAGADHIANLVDVLTMLPESAQVEPGRIQLIANQLATELDRHKVVDWDRREAVQAKLRNVARVILRKYGYPVSIRDQVVEHVLEAAKEDLGMMGS